MNNYWPSITLLHNTDLSDPFVAVLDLTRKFLRNMTVHSKDISVHSHVLFSIGAVLSAC